MMRACNPGRNRSTSASDAATPAKYSSSESSSRCVYQARPTVNWTPSKLGVQCSRAAYTPRTHAAHSPTESTARRCTTPSTTEVALQLAEKFWSKYAIDANGVAETRVGRHAV